MRALTDPDPHHDLWDAVAIKASWITDHVSGTKVRDGMIPLAMVVAEFHTRALTGGFDMDADRLTALLGSYPQGAFSSRAGSKTFAKDVRNLWDKCSQRAAEAFKKEQEQAAEDASYLTISDEPWDEDALPRRPWLVPPYMMRGQIAVLHGPGSAGKSMLVIVWAIALALGKPFGRLKPKQRCRVVVANFEDDEEEQKRRLSAALQFFGAKPADLKGWLFRVSLGPKGDATMFELGESGQITTSSCFHTLERACERIQPDAVTLDPFVAINAVPESDNQLMRRVMTLLKLTLARRLHCALALVHHDNKSANEDDDSDQTNARGAGDIINAARFEVAVKKMTLKQAEGWGIDVAKRGFFFRAGSIASKRNYAAPEEAEWFERLAVVVAGEETVRCIPWEPPSARLDDAQAAAVVAAVEKGTVHGPYSTQLSNTARSLVPVLAGLGITKPALQRRVLTDLLKSEKIVKAKWRPQGQGDKMPPAVGLRSASGRPYNWEWCEEAEQ
jgi:hypothetical protein